MINKTFIVSCAFFFKAKLALGFMTRDPSKTNFIFLRLQNVISILDLMLSFVIPFMSMTVLKMFSNVFFYMCMTSRLW